MVKDEVTSTGSHIMKSTVESMIHDPSMFCIHLKLNYIRKI